MFKFSDIIVGTKDHAHLMRCLGELSAEGKEVNYQEYVTEKGKREIVSAPYNFPNKHEDEKYVVYRGREVKCRGHAIP